MLNTDNPFGTDAFAAPAPDFVKVKPHRLPKTKRGTRAMRPLLPSVVIKNFLLTYNG